MIASQKRLLLLAAVAIAAAWILAVAGYLFAKNSRMTAAKVRAYAESVDLAALTGEARAAAIRELAARLNRLTVEERRRARMERVWERWFEGMTEEEKGGFIEATMPTGFKQMLASFEELPEERRRKAIVDATRRMKEAQERMQQEGGLPPEAGGTNGPPPLSEELQQRITRIGLKTFYSESTAKTKAELAPVLEELQRMMESGRMFRR